MQLIREIGRNGGGRRNIKIWFSAGVYEETQSGSQIQLMWYYWVLNWKNVE